MTIRDRIFDKLEELGMTQKEFSERTGIAESTISDWKKKKTNPTAEKIMPICKTLDVRIEWLLSGVETHGDRGGPRDWLAVEVETDSGKLLMTFNSLDKSRQERLLGYAEALGEAVREEKSGERKEI